MDEADIAVAEEVLPRSLRHDRERHGGDHRAEQDRQCAGKDRTRGGGPSELEAGHDFALFPVRQDVGAAAHLLKDRKQQREGQQAERELRGAAPVAEGEPRLVDAGGEGRYAEE